MNKKQVENFAEEKLKEWGLWEKGWRFRWNRRKTALGVCRYRQKHICLSEIWFAATTDYSETKDTILHEIAHALAGSAAGHGSLWQRWAVKVGANPARCYDASAGSVDLEKINETAKYTAQCTNCGYKTHFNRLGRGWRMGRACGQCCDLYANGKPDARFKLTITQNY